MKKHKITVWFPAKTQGVGWGLPNTWQGWTVVLIYFFLSTIGIKITQQVSIGIPLYLGYFTVLTILFVFIVWKKGERKKENKHVGR